MVKKEKRKQLREKLEDELAIIFLREKIRTAKKRKEIRQQYDVLASNGKRRKAKIEREGETESYTSFLRAITCNYTRDLERNYSPVGGILEQFKNNVVGAEGGKIKINLESEAAKKSTAWFNSVWAKDCDAKIPGVHWAEWLSLIVTSVIRDGDVLIAVDTGLDFPDEKLLVWESDQIVPLSEKNFRHAIEEKKIPEGTVQDSGVVRTNTGKVIGYTCTSRYGLTNIEDDDWIFLPTEVARLVRIPLRHNQGRGVSLLLSTTANYYDLYEILAAELATAKRAAQQYAYVKRQSAAMDWDSDGLGKELLPEHVGKTQEQVEAEIHQAPTYEQLENMTGGMVDYLDAEDQVEFPKIERPNVNLTAFLDAVLGFSGARLGLASTYTKLRADTSYTAFRGDMLLSWAMFFRVQKWLERSVADWVAKRVLRVAMREEKIPELPDGWEEKISWKWPKMPEVNVIDAERATAQALKNGSTNFSEILGSDWKEKLESYAKEIDVIRQLRLPLEVFETKSGGVMTEK